MQSSTNSPSSSKRQGDDEASATLPRKRKALPVSPVADAGAVALRLGGPPVGPVQHLDAAFEVTVFGAGCDGQLAADMPATAVRTGLVFADSNEPVPAAAATVVVVASPHATHSQDQQPHAKHSQDQQPHATHSQDQQPHATHSQDQQGVAVRLACGRATYHVRVTGLTRDNAGRAFALCVAPAAPFVEDTAAASRCPSLEVLPVYSSAFTVVARHLHVTLAAAAPARQAAETGVLHWFNQMGGQHNCIEVRVELRDAANAVRPLDSGLAVPLCVALHYADGEREAVRSVGGKALLTVEPPSGGSRLGTDASGRAVLRVRIEEVSTRHQKRHFFLRVSPDVGADPLGAGAVAPTDSGPINVLSKITNHRPKAAASGTGTQAPASAPGTALDRRFPAVVDDDVLNPSSTNNTSSSSGGGNSSSSSSGGCNSSSCGGDLVAGPKGGSDAVCALQSVLTWVEGALAALEASKWQLAGHDAATGRPLYCMLNPNARIEATQEQYQADAMGALSVLLAAVEQPSQKSQGIGTASAAREAEADSGGGSVGAAGGAAPFELPTMRRAGSLDVDALESLAARAPAGEVYPFLRLGSDLGLDDDDDDLGRDLNLSFPGLASLSRAASAASAAASWPRDELPNPRLHMEV